MRLTFLTESEFLKRAEHQLEVMNYALGNIPAQSLRMHVCWGNYEGPHDHDIALEKVIGIILKAKPSAIQFEASNPRHAHEWIGEFEDEFVRTAEGWRIAARRARFVMHA